MMDPVASLMERDFIPEQDAVYQFDPNLWREGFYMLLKLLSSEQLVIEEFSPQVCSSDRSHNVVVVDNSSETACGMASCWRHSR
jgi:hypothetical protein